MESVRRMLASFRTVSTETMSEIWLYAVQIRTVHQYAGSSVVEQGTLDSSVVGSIPILRSSFKCGPVA
jgi:hypothetical protein